MNLVAFVTVGGSVFVCAQIRYRNITDAKKSIARFSDINTSQGKDLTGTSGRSDESKIDQRSIVVESTTSTVLFRSCCQQQIILLLLLLSTFVKYIITSGILFTLYLYIGKGFLFSGSRKSLHEKHCLFFF